MPFSTEKLEWCGYPTVKRFEDMFIHFDRMYERDRHTDGQTDGHRMTAMAALS